APLPRRLTSAHEPEGRRRGTEDRRLQPPGAARLRDPRALRDRDRAHRRRGEVAPRWPGVARRGLRARPGPRDLARGHAHPALRAGDGQGPVGADPPPQAVAPPQGDRAPERHNGREGARADPAPRVLRARVGQARARARAGQAAVREAPGDRRARAPARDGSGVRPAALGDEGRSYTCRTTTYGGALASTWTRTVQGKRAEVPG